MLPSSSIEKFLAKAGFAAAIIPVLVADTAKNDDLDFGTNFELTFDLSKIDLARFSAYLHVRSNRYPHHV